MVIPSSTLKSFELGPSTTHATLLLRHAHRPSFAPTSFGNEVDLTPDGVGMAEELGVVLGSRLPGILLTSPIVRCVSTLKAIVRGAGWKVSISEDWRLGEPGVFMADPSASIPLALEIGAFELVRRQLCEREPLPGMRPISEGVSLLLNAFTVQTSQPDTLDVLVTHDSILAAVVGFLLGTECIATPWPDFLEGLFLWHQSRGLSIAWRGERQEVAWYKG